MWMKPQNKKNLIELYSASDIVFDQFVLQEFGQVFLEAMSCGVPTFIYLKGCDQLYKESPPCVNVFSEDEIFEKLMELTESPLKLREIGIKSREWIKKYHDWRLSVKLYRNLYESILVR